MRVHYFGEKISQISRFWAETVKLNSFLSPMMSRCENYYSKFILRKLGVVIHCQMKQWKIDPKKFKEKKIYQPKPTNFYGMFGLYSIPWDFFTAPTVCCKYLFQTLMFNQNLDKSSCNPAQNFLTNMIRLKYGKVFFWSGDSPLGGHRNENLFQLKDFGRLAGSGVCT